MLATTRFCFWISVVCRFCSSTEKSPYALKLKTTKTNRSFSIRYRPQILEMETKLKPFLPDFIPAVGDPDAFLKIDRPDGAAEMLGLTVIDEPSVLLNLAVVAIITVTSLICTSLTYLAQPDRSVCFGFTSTFNLQAKLCQNNGKTFCLPRNRKFKFLLSTYVPSEQNKIVDFEDNFGNLALISEIIPKVYLFIWLGHDILYPILL